MASHLARPGPLGVPQRVPGAQVSIPPHSAPPRRRTGAHHLLCTPQPRPTRRRAAEGTGRERESWAQLRAIRESSCSPCSGDTAATGQIPEGFSGRADLGARMGVGWGQLQRQGCGVRTRRNFTFLREGESSLTLLSLRSSPEATVGPVRAHLLPYQGFGRLDALVSACWVVWFAWA